MSTCLMSASYSKSCSVHLTTPLRVVPFYLDVKIMLHTRVSNDQQFQLKSFLQLLPEPCLPFVAEYRPQVETVQNTCAPFSCNRTCWNCTLDYWDPHDFMNNSSALSELAAASPVPSKTHLDLSYLIHMPSHHLARMHLITQRKPGFSRAPQRTLLLRLQSSARSLLSSRLASLWPQLKSTI